MLEGKGHIPRAYRQMIQEMDRGIGEVVATIDRLDLARRTLVFFFSDNGGNPNGSNTPLRGFKSQLWEGGHRVPAIARWTGRIEPNSICDEPCISIDIMPTMLDLTGTQPPPGHQLDGTSLIPVLLENHGLGDRALFWDYRNHQAMRQGPWKLIVTKHGVESVGLYNLADDLSEKHNLAKQHPQRSHAMLAAIAAWQEDVTTPPEPQAVNHGTGHEGP
jgi:arylsulfatase A-like enzyme